MTKKFCDRCGNEIIAEQLLFYLNSRIPGTLDSPGEIVLAEVEVIALPRNNPYRDPDPVDYCVDCRYKIIQSGLPWTFPRKGTVIEFPVTFDTTNDLHG